MSKGACAEMDSKIFFAETKSFIKLAIGICNSCSVKVECLEYALVNDERGIWGGTTEMRRRLIQKQNKISIIE